ncbi:sigma-54 interaction domain-containing protein [Halobacillus naozhouensis]|uniref:Sigma 54-interacting transcriptional regulator n=1 Tax=Halobacillus naozhouensis TaxID=554880 RepID=A0ABY8IWW0_9BACI|nr:sigma 54-interacting transcriptional regulator [Halobacillus naozhouensis]WFT74732.1 sigma 54-interacting transcriptional regulator [Halobacillus naozhouensis]
MLSVRGEYKDELFETILENAYHCFVVVDRNGVVTYMNKTYCRFLEVYESEVIGKHVTDVIENTRMHIVASTGKEEIADLQFIRGNHMVANRIPVMSGEKVVGAVGTVLFRDTKEWMVLNSHIKDLLLELEFYREQMKSHHGVVYSLHDIAANSPKMVQIKETVKQIAPGDVSILLNGESGTGKELFAHSIHLLSERHTKPFVKVNCAAIPENLIESELFGYKEGAFTGAKKGGKLGKFQLADGGTLFLDEIGDMPLNAQVKLLRVLQEKEVEAVGAVHPQKIDIRIVAATNKSLERLVEEKRFREDLFYRVNVIQIDIPPLRERSEDIAMLAEFFLQKVTDRTGKRVTEFTSEVVERLKQYKWQGNVRELENVVEAAVHLCHSSTITMADLPGYLQSPTLSSVEGLTLKEIIQNTEQKAIENTLQQTDGNKLEAARRLGLSKSSFYEKLKKHQI